MDLRGDRWSGRGCPTVRRNRGGRSRSGVGRASVVGLVLLVATLATAASGAGAAASPSSNGTVAPIDGTTPRDVNDDGRYMDLNGNGEIDFDDVVTYFGHMDDPAMTDNAAAYDYNGNGEVDFADLVTLFEWTDRPAARFEVDGSATTVGTPVPFDATGSSGVGSDGSYQWSFGDGATASGATATHAYSEPGSYEVTLAVTDADDVRNATTRTITVRSDGDRERTSRATSE